MARDLNQSGLERFVTYREIPCAYSSYRSMHLRGQSMKRPGRNRMLAHLLSHRRFAEMPRARGGLRNAALVLKKRTAMEHDFARCFVPFSGAHISIAAAL